MLSGFLLRVDTWCRAPAELHGVCRFRKPNLAFWVDEALVVRWEDGTLSLACLFILETFSTRTAGFLPGHMGVESGPVSHC